MPIEKWAFVKFWKLWRTKRWVVNNISKNTGFKEISQIIAIS